MLIILLEQTTLLRQKDVTIIKGQNGSGPQDTSCEQCSNLI